MIRRALLLIALSLVLAAIVHIATIMAIPRLAPADGWSRVAALVAPGRAVPLPRAQPGEDTLPMLDPAMAYAVCRYDLTKGPFAISAPIPPHFWSVSLHTRGGVVFYAVTERAATSDVFDIELRNDFQMRRFHIAVPEPEESTLFLEAPANIGLALIRALVTDRHERARIEAVLAGTYCGPAPDRAPAPEVPVIPFPVPSPR